MRRRAAPGAGVAGAGAPDEVGARGCGRGGTGPGGAARGRAPAKQPGPSGGTGRSGASGGAGTGGGGRGQRHPPVTVVEPVPAVLRSDEHGAAARRNRRRALALCALPAIVVLVVVVVVLTAVGLVVVGVVAGVLAGAATALALWWGATGLLLRALGACPGDDEIARAENLVDGLCASMGVAAPDLAVVDEAARDALAVGRRNGAATIVVTSGLLRALDPVSLEAVLAHELTHVRRGDIAPATMAAAVCLPFAAVVPGTPGLVHTLAGRGREFDTDQMAVTVTRYPPGLRDALALMAGGPLPRPPSPLAGRGWPGPPAGCGRSAFPRRPVRPLACARSRRGARRPPRPHRRARRTLTASSGWRSPRPAPSSTTRTHRRARDVGGAPGPRRYTAGMEHATPHRLPRRIRPTLRARPSSAAPRPSP